LINDMSAFETAAKEAKELPKKPSNDDLLRLYGLYKQATVGDNTTGQPYMVQVESRAKWDAWTKHKGTSKADAENQYVALVQELKTKYA
jgi:diazepam-binding inhibitor (GABA receptor modulating acyl-CoA-binding protein)